MKLQDALYAALQLKKVHPDLFSNVEVELAFGTGRPCIGDWSDPENLGMLVAGDGIGSKSGVYCFASPNGDIVYIGKATKNNLHHRVWDHVKTPEVLGDGWRTFPKHGFRGAVEAEGHESNVLNGRIHLGVVTISDQELVSLVEVYLQTLHKKQHHRLPVFNKQIG